MRIGVRFGEQGSDLIDGNAFNDPYVAVGVKMDIGIMGTGKNEGNLLPSQIFNTAPVHIDVGYDRQGER